MDNNTSKNNFNLIPKEIYSKREKKRQSQDKTVFFSAIFPFLAIVVWLIFLLLRLEVKKDTDGLHKSILDTETELQQYEAEKLTNAELVLKTRLLKEIVKNDVNPEDFFKIVQDTISSSGRDIKVLEYGKNNEGNFSITAEAGDIKNITDIVRIFRELEQLDSVMIVSILYPANTAQNTTTKYEFEMAFKILTVTN